MVVVYKFIHRGKWVRETRPAYYFWTQFYHSDNVFKYVLYYAFDKPLLWVCQRLNKEWNIPSIYWNWGYQERISIGKAKLDLGHWLYHFLWSRDHERYEKTRPRTSCSDCRRIIVKEEGEAFNGRCYKCWQQAKAPL